MTNEKEILSKLKLLYLPQLSNKVEIAKIMQVQFFNEAIENLLNQKSKINFELFKKHCLKLLDIFEVKYLTPPNLPGKGIYILNHFPFHKLTKVYLKELNVQSNNFDELMNNDPFPLILAPAIKFTYNQKIEKNNFIIITSRFKYPFNEVMDSCNIFSINREARGGYKKIYQFLKLNPLIENIFIYPEPGSSGKKSKRQPYELEEFRSGYFNLSLDLKLAIIPIVHGIDSSMNYYIEVLDTLKGDDCSPENSRKIMQNKILNYVQ